jgi:hypothetical protein
MRRSHTIWLFMVVLGSFGWSFGCEIGEAEPGPDYWADASAGSGGDSEGGSGGGEGGTGGTEVGGSGGGVSGSGGGSGGGTSGGTCSLELTGATGNEPGGQIPVCCAPTPSEKAEIEAVFALLNEHRANNGVPALAYDDKLEAAIQGHCIHMVQHPFFDHSAPESEVSSPWTRAEMCGTSASGENIAGGQSSPQDVMDSWKSSSGHNDNMLDGKFKRVGIGRHGSYWGQIFGT